MWHRIRLNLSSDERHAGNQRPSRREAIELSESCVEARARGLQPARAFCMNSVVLCTPRAWIGQEANEALFQNEAIPGLQPGLRGRTWATKVVAAELPRLWSGVWTSCTRPQGAASLQAGL